MHEGLYLTIGGVQTDSMKIYKWDISEMLIQLMA